MGAISYLAWSWRLIGICGTQQRASERYDFFAFPLPSGFSTYSYDLPPGLEVSFVTEPVRHGGEDAKEEVERQTRQVLIACSFAFPTTKNNMIVI